MEVSSLPQQSVQINLNNKIITLHNVTIVKNPRIVKVDATQYSNLLKGAAGSQIKLVNGGGTANALKFPALVPIKSSQAPNIFKAANPVIVNQTPVIKQAPNFVSTQVIKTFQPVNSNGIVQLKTSPAKILASPQQQQQPPPQQQQQIATVVSPLKIQTFPVKSQPTVIISPPKNQPVNGTSPVFAHSPKPAMQVNVNIQSPVQQLQVATNQTSVITTKPAVSPTTANYQVFPIQTKVIVSPPLKNKTSPCETALPEAKRSCRKLDFQCIFCQEVFFEEPQLLVEHMQKKHPEKIPKDNKGISQQQQQYPVIEEAKSKINKEPEILPPVNDVKADTDTSSSDDDSESDEENSSDMQDDDESEVNDLIMDLEDTQDTESSQNRSNTPESPEFEEHVPSQNSAPLSENEEEDYTNEDEYEWDVLNLMLEPICELMYEQDLDENLSRLENEAMRLYREAMEINYEQNGIKKRGRRKNRPPKPAEQQSMNGILANLLDPSISLKIPQGPGRGRRKETNEEELEADRNNGICFFQCTQCDKSFKYAGDLAKHVRSHTINSPYRCSICSKIFTHIGSLSTHLRIHSGERPYKCKFCEKSFTQSNSLMVHVKSHLSNKPYSCNQCNKGFLNASSLALHQKTHTVPTTVVCPIETCGKEFRDNNLLEEHMQTHKQSMLYQCSLCLEKFEQACQLVQHVKTHIGDKPFQCTICSRAFTQPGSLSTHLRIHTGEKPFACTLCPKKFTQASSLSVHMKIHGEKEFKCEICNKSYSQEVFLLKHKLKHKSDAQNGDANDSLQDDGLMDLVNFQN